MRSECFVYITLPAHVSAVTAGKLVVERDRRGDPNGRFVYGRSYLARKDAVEIDPVELKLTGGTFETTRLHGLFGALRDAGPDAWGRRIVERHAGKPQLDEIDYLLHSPDDRAGALGFGLHVDPPAPMRAFNQTLDLARVQAVADALIAEERRGDDAITVQVEELLLIGTSMGGARPKTVVEDDAGLWLAKLNRGDDRFNNARVEHAMLQLARTCGIASAESRVVEVGGRDVLLVKRFDRERVEGGYTRARMISALTLLHADDGARDRDKWSYLGLVEELRRASGVPADDAAELFRRMCFNALISNLDDHPRNHALLAKGTDWRLSPAFDLTPALPIAEERRDLAMTVGDAGRWANRDNILSQSARFLLKPAQAAAIVDEMTKRVAATWYGVARAAGVSERDCGLIAGAFVHAGFGLPTAAVRDIVQQFRRRPDADARSLRAIADDLYDDDGLPK